MVRLIERWRCRQCGHLAYRHRTMSGKASYQNTACGPEAFDTTKPPACKCPGFLPSDDVPKPIYKGGGW